MISFVRVISMVSMINIVIVFSLANNSIVNMTSIVGISCIVIIVSIVRSRIWSVVMVSKECISVNQVSVRNKV